MLLLVLYQKWHQTSNSGNTFGSKNLWTLNPKTLNPCWTLVGCLGTTRVPGTSPFVSVGDQAHGRVAICWPSCATHVQWRRKSRRMNKIMTSTHKRKSSTHKTRSSTIAFCLNILCFAFVGIFFVSALRIWSWALCDLWIRVGGWGEKSKRRCGSVFWFCSSFREFAFEFDLIWFLGGFV